MADHRIGLNLDVKNTTALDRLQNEFRDIGDAADQIRARFERLDQYSNQMMRSGFGSASYTRELRDQLNLVQQMARVYENEARRTGNAGALQSLQSSQASLGGLNGQLSAYGNIQSNSFGGRLASFGKGVGLTALGTLTAMPLSMLMSGYGAAMSMLPQAANFSQTMVNNPSQATNAWFYNMLGSAQGYGYNNQQILAGAQTLQGAMGRSNNFNSYMQGVAQFGRSNGFDFNQAASYFSQNYQAGGNLSPLQYATLVAQTVNSANMQGKNGQVAEAINQLSTLSSQMSLNANTQQNAQLYATGASSGNQAWKNNLGKTLAAVNSGIMNPGGGVMGQAMMIQALMPGLSAQDRNYFGEQMLQSGGLSASPYSTFHRGSKETNMQRFMTYAYKQYGGNTEAADIALSQVLPITPKYAMQLMNTYMKGGHWNEVTEKPNDKKTQNAIKHSNNSQLDHMNEKHVKAGQNAQKSASRFMGLVTDVENIVGAHPITSLLVGTGALKVGNSAMNAVGKGLFKGGNKLLRPVTRGATSLLGRAGSWARGLLGRSITGDAIAGGLDATGAALEVGGTAADATGIGAIGGIPANILGGLLLGGGALTGWLMGRNHKSASSSHSSTTSVKIPTDIQSEVSNVVAVLMALRPWAGQINQWYSTSAASSVSGTVSSLGNAKLSSTASLIQNIPNANPVTATPSSGQYMNLGYSGSFNASAFSGPSGSTYTGSGSASSFTSSLKPYALQVAKSLGIPSSEQSSFAQFVLAQWGLESGNGTSYVSQADDNLGGITYYNGISVGTKGSARPASEGGNYVKYSSLSQFAQGYASFLKDNPKNYSSFLNAAKSGASAQELARIMSDGPYASANGSSYYNGIMSHLNANAPYYGSAPSNVNVTVSAKPVTITIKDSNGNKGSKTIRFNTTTAVHQN